MKNKNLLRMVVAGMMVAMSGVVHAQADTQGAAMFPFVLPWDDASAGPTDMSGWLDKPAGKDGFVAVRDGHFYVGEKRIRFFGVNLAFNANFPSHEDAEKIAARMAKFGINCVRFHHMDTQPSPTGLLDQEYRHIDPVQLDKLDYFIAQLKARGIYTNLNLHVGRRYPDEKIGGYNTFFKGVDQFMPRMIELQKEFARELLTHVNPYTKLSYVDDPAVAFVEINNENGLINRWQAGDLDAITADQAQEMTRQWRAWLKAHYPKGDGQLRDAWKEGTQEAGMQMLDGDFSHWHLEQHEGAKAANTISQKKEDLPAELKDNDAASSVMIQVSKTGHESWHVQYSHPSFALKGGVTYTAEVWARAKTPCEVTFVAGQSRAPWGLYNINRMKLTDKWQKFSLVFSVSDGEANARVILSGLGNRVGEYQFAGAALRTTVINGLAEKEAIDTVTSWSKDEFNHRTTAAQRDWARFMYDTEDAYWSQMQDYLQSDLHVQSPLIGTQMGYSNFAIQSKFDVIDAHAYWQHPHFPGKPWDPDNWVVGTKSMVTAENGGELGHIANTRMYGKPFVCTEYNHPAPNQFASEAFLLAAAYGAQQDWDGIFVFAYSHSLEGGKSGKITSFFDLAQHPTKLAVMPAVISMFEFGGVPRLNPHSYKIATPTLDQVIEKIRTWKSGPGYADFVEGGANASLSAPVAVALAGTKGLPVFDVATGIGPQSVMKWDSEKGLVEIAGKQTVCVVGYFDNAVSTLGAVSFERHTPAGWAAGKPPFDRRWCTLSATVMRGEDFASAKSVVISATGGAINKNMKWRNNDKNTVGQDWGTSPSIVEGIDATITLPMKNARVWALDEKGQRKEEVPVKNVAGGIQFEIGPKYKTLWYEAGIR